MMPHPNISLGLTADFGKMNKGAGPSFQKTAFFSCSRFLQTLFFRSNSSRFVKYIFSKKKKKFIKILKSSWVILKSYLASDLSAVTSSARIRRSYCLWLNTRLCQYSLFNAVFSTCSDVDELISGNKTINWKKKKPVNKTK